MPRVSTPIAAAMSAYLSGAAGWLYVHTLGNPTPLFRPW